MVEIKEVNDLLNENGHLQNPGYSKQMLQKYNRSQIKASKFKIKEWDYYLIHNKKYAIALTVADNSYMGMLSASVINFETPIEKTTSVITLFPMGKLNMNLETHTKTNMPNSSKTGDVIFKNKRCDFRFFHDGNNRHLYCKFLKFDKEKDLDVDLILTNEPKESIVIATPFNKNKKAFYYNQKIVGFNAYGEVTYGDEKIKFKKDDSFALLDWGRGVWTYKNTWYWGSGMTQINGKPFGFNIGYGFGDNSYATENSLFYNGAMHKLEHVNFNIPKTSDGKDDFLKDWSFTSNNKRFEMTFKPIINRKSDTNLLVLRSNQNQIFGYFNGYVILDDGTKLEVKNMLGFAEKVFNKW